jgi:hypothetical protein
MNVYQRTYRQDEASRAAVLTSEAFTPPNPYVGLLHEWELTQVAEHREQQSVQVAGHLNGQVAYRQFMGERSQAVMSRLKIRSYRP